MKLKISPLSLLLAMSCHYSQAEATSFSGLYVFGDSISDSGNSASAVESIFKLEGNKCDSAHPCPPYDAGRLSNGPVGVEYVANSLFPGGASVSNFHDYAVAGATSGIGNIADGGTATSPGAYDAPGMYQELQLYLSGIKTTGTDPNALYLVWGGANDLTIGSSPIAAADNISSYVDALAAVGAHNIIVPNMPDLGLTPDAITAGPAAETFSTQESLAFNQELATKLDSLSVLFPNTDIVQFNTYSSFNNLIANAAAYGFTNTTAACFVSATQVCSNPGNYIFWDGEHTTTAVDQVLGNLLVSAVPIPPGFWLFATGLCGWIFSRKR